MVQTPAKSPTLEEFLQRPETKPASEYIDSQTIAYLYQRLRPDCSLPPVLSLAGFQSSQVVAIGDQLILKIV